MALFVKNANRGRISGLLSHEEFLKGGTPPQIGPWGWCVSNS